MGISVFMSYENDLCFINFNGYRKGPGLLNSGSALPLNFRGKKKALVFVSVIGSVPAWQPCQRTRLIGLPTRLQPYIDVYTYTYVYFLVSLLRYVYHTNAPVQACASLIGLHKGLAPSVCRMQWGSAHVSDLTHISVFEIVGISRVRNACQLV